MQSTVSSDESSSMIITRKAINAYGRLGSLYDCCRDQLLVQENRCALGQSFRSFRPAKCMVIDGNSDASDNLLRFMDVENDLRVSLLLKLTPRIGIAAILNYSHRIDEHTRFLYYSSIDREEKISVEAMRNLNLIGKTQTSATHIITDITYGIDVLVVLQLSPETDHFVDIDRILHRISRSLSNDNELDVILTHEEQNYLRKIINIQFYSNIPDLTALNSISELIHQINIIKKKSNFCPPIIYSLQSLSKLYREYMTSNALVCFLPSEILYNIEQYVLERRAIINLLRSLQEKRLKSLPGYLQGRLYGANKQYIEIKHKYMNEIQQLSNLVINFRHGQIEQSIVKDALIDKQPTTLKKDASELIRNINDLEAKVNFINDLLSQNFSYCNVVERDVNKSDNEGTIRTKLIVFDNRDRVLCSNDTLNKFNPKQLNRLRSYLIEESQQNRNLRLIYADFSYSSYQLHNMDILTSTNRVYGKTLSTQKSYPSFTDASTSVSSYLKEQPSEPPVIKICNAIQPSSADNIINILLLGETGVGKSTFINAFVNYLRFNSLKEAQLNQPIVTIPVSFIMTVGDNFEERTIKFADVNNSHNHNEDFYHPGQSVTQHCKSYMFHLRPSDGYHRKRLRIIDTPGFGDTRGRSQDERNMDNILQYVNNLTHLNAICFLLKPNASRLSIFFRTCFTQLFSLLGPTARNNIIFCFTNARSTFFSPGNTASLLKNMLASSSMQDISLKKENTFCFDSESFRYLVALRNGIVFSEEEKYEYETSWLTSVKESNRLIDYIRRTLIPYPIRSGWQSIKHAQTEISYLIRPILETIRNNLRNIILSKLNLSNISIELYPKPLFRSSAICSSCKRDSGRLAHFWITLDNPHEFENKCYTCSCAPDRHIPIDYMLEYRTKSNFAGYRTNEINVMLRQIYFASAEFSHFLIYGSRSTNSDPFLLGLMRMIRREKVICQENSANQMNMRLITELEKAQYEYEKQMCEVASNQNRKKLAIIYEQMKTVRSYPGIREQMLAVEQTQREIMKQREVIF